MGFGYSYFDIGIYLVFGAWVLGFLRLARFGYLKCLKFEVPKMPKVLEVVELKKYERHNADTLAHSKLEVLQTYGGHGE